MKTGWMGQSPSARAFAICLISISGCAELDNTVDPTPAPIELSQVPPTPQAQSSTQAQWTPSSATVTGPRASRQVGTGVFLNSDVARQPLPTDPLVVQEPGGEYSVNLVNVPIVQATEAILGDTLNLDFAVESGVEGNITVLTSRPLRASDLLETFRVALDVNNLELAQEGGIYLVRESESVFPRVRSFGVAGGTDQTVYALPLSFVSVDEMLRILQPIASPTTTLQAVPGRNILLASGSVTDIESVVDTVNLFDVDLLEGKSVSLVSLLSVDPETVAQELELVFDSYAGGALDGVISFVPNNELKSILIITSQPKYLVQAESWIRTYEASVSGEVHTAAIYRLENRAAVDLAPMLEELLSFGTLSLQEGADAPGAIDELVSSDPTQPTLASTAADPDVARIVADDVSNTIIVYATPGQHDEIARLIKRLDSVANQVLIEATIAEVRLTDELDFGVRWFLESGNFGFNFSGVSALSGAVFPGFNATFTGGSEARVALNALSSVTDVNIVSSPSLLVLDNRQATLNVGDQVPVATQSSVTVNDPDAPIVNSITQLNTGVILNIRPRVSSSGRIILDIQQEVSDAVATTSSGIDSPTVQQRIITTSVAVDDGQSIVLGGLIRSRESETRNSVPLLGDIPLVGSLFRSKVDDVERTELLIFITPRVIRDPLAARQITDEYRSRLSKSIGVATLPDRSFSHQLKRILY